MKILLVASEADPFIKSGGLGDVIGSLPKYLKSNDIEASVVIPNYKNIKSDLKNKFQFIASLNVKVGWRNSYCGVFKYKLNGVNFYFIDNESYFLRDNLYGYFDDGERFAYFDRAVLEMIKFIDYKPDIIHCNDWQTGMIPVLLELEYKKDNFYKDIKTIFSIHNLAFQGNYNPNILGELFGYDMEPFNNGSLNHFGAVSFMKGGINYSNKVSTVSETYSREIQTNQYGETLDGLLRDTSFKLTGIVNGIDYEVYNPKKDSYIEFNYDQDNLENKLRNKLSLQKELGLAQKENVPMISMVSRLTSQKGMDLIVSIADRLLQKDIQLVVLGTGDYGYEEHLKNFQRCYRDKVSANIKFSNELAHKIYAASDIFLMPSLFEPCGLGQLIALRYGTIPLVRETGGLKDTIVPYNEYTEEGNGFSFYNYNSNELLNTIEYALRWYEDKDKWINIVKSAMKSNNSWNKAAKEYKSLYKELLKEEF
ncbi:glycogen synthase GlgA [Clostridium fallax]|uniref:glycogen synthase GlgA n=1 Tax=Clostridium fallax TaxID=1533 RepID=UPI000934DB24|nr:glycogen synthase GlgA [Clostridium fallax]